MWYNTTEVNTCMKKILIVLCLLVLFSGCQQKVNVDDSRQEKYDSYIIAVQDIEDSKETSAFFDVSCVMNKLSENEYRYDVIIENPKVAMYTVEVLAVETTVAGTVITDKLMPSVGIFDEVTYNMIPNQVDIEKGYPKGISVSGVTDRSEITLYVMVSWTGGRARAVQSREFLKVVAAMEQPSSAE